jgi:hypothetical protein
VVSDKASILPSYEILTTWNLFELPEVDDSGTTELNRLLVTVVVLATRRTRKTVVVFSIDRDKKPQRPVYTARINVGRNAMFGQLSAYVDSRLIDVSMLL